MVQPLKPGSKAHKIVYEQIVRALTVAPIEARYRQPKNFTVNLRLVDRLVFEKLGDGNVARGVELAARIVRELWFEE
jgi:hypothetical protein